MRVYSGKIRLNGDLRWEVRRDRITAPEVLVLRYLHGGDSVVDLKYIDDLSKEDAADERARLESEYWINPTKDENPIAKLFGPAHIALPLVAPNSPDKKVSADPIEKTVDQPEKGKKTPRVEDLAA